MVVDGTSQSPRGLDGVRGQREGYDLGETEDGPTGYRPRPIVVKFLRFKNLRTYIFLNEDYPETVCQKRQEIIPTMKAARAHGNIAYICYDMLIVHPPGQKSERDERAKPMGS